MVHEKDFHALFDRVALNLGKSSAEQMEMPIDVRKTLATGITDPGLEELLFQYGRYLLISCSRPGGLPADTCRDFGMTATTRRGIPTIMPTSTWK